MTDEELKSLMQEWVNRPGLQSWKIKLLTKQKADAKKPLGDSTLYHKAKTELIQIIRDYEHNYEALWEANERGIKAAQEMLSKKGKWVESHKHLWMLDENGNIDMWALDIGFHNGQRCVKCHDTFCEHCTPDWAERECDFPHYVCSDCGFATEQKSNYCPKCGAKMEDQDG